MNVEPGAAARSTGLSLLRDKRGLSTLEYAVLFVVLLIGGLALWKGLAGSMSKNVGAASDEFSSVLGGSQPSWKTPVGTDSSTDHAPPGGGGMITGRPAVPAGSLPAPSSVAFPSKQDTTQQPPAQQAREPGLWDSAKAFVRESANSQLALGIAAGTAGSIVWPLGFVPSPEGAGRNFEAGRAIGETATGIAQIYGGAAAILGGTAGGGASLAAAVPSGGTSLAGLIPSGAAVHAGVVMAGVGLTNVGRGLWRGYNAMQMADDSAAGGGSSNGSSGNPSGTRNATSPGDAPSTTIASATSASRELTNTNAIRFTQDSIGTTFRDGRSVKALIEGLKSGKIKPEDLPPIRVFEKDGLTYTLDNRRLFAAHQAGVPVRTVPATAAELAKELPRKFTTANQGQSIGIRGFLE